MIIDTGPCHNLDDDGKKWLHKNRHRIELHRLPPYSPELNPMEPVWKTTRIMTTHNSAIRVITDVLIASYSWLDDRLPVRVYDVAVASIPIEPVGGIEVVETDSAFADDER